METVYYLMRGETFWSTNSGQWVRREFATGMTEHQAHNIARKRFKNRNVFVVSVRIEEHLSTTQALERLRSSGL